VAAVAAALAASPTRAADPDDFWWDGFDLWPNGQGLVPDAGIVTVSDFVEYEGHLVAGGIFIGAGDKTDVGNVARWNGTEWRRMGFGCHDEVEALTVYDGDLIVGGRFTTVNVNTIALRIASWNPSRVPAWQPMGGGVSGGPSTPSVRVVEPYDGLLYAGGVFSSPGESIVSWNGTTWTEVGGGVSSDEFSPTSVRALCVFEGKLIVGGAFLEAGGIWSPFVAAWDGSSFSALGEGLPGGVSDLTIHDGELYAVGSFVLNPGPNQCWGVARWDGTVWQPVGTGFSSNAHKVHSFGGDLYVSGSFTQAGGQPAKSIARWDGSTWNPLGTGVSTWGIGLADYHGDLYVGITGTCVAGGKPSLGIGRWMDTGPLGTAAHGTGVVWFDPNLDGRDDLYVTAWTGESNVFMRNDGDFAFTDITAPPIDLIAAASVAPAAADYDHDGDDDLCVANALGSPTKLFRNDGGSFVDSGLIGANGQAVAATWADVDADGYADLWIAQGVDAGAANLLYRNNAGSGFTHMDGVISAEAWGGGAAWGDYDADGDADLYQAGQGPDQPNQLFRNDGLWLFTDATTPLLADTGSGRGVAWGDVDNDLDLDLALANDFGGPGRLFRNDGSGNWVNIAPPDLAALAESRGVAWADVDNDADLDLYVCRNGPDLLLRNDGGSWTNIGTDRDSNTSSCAWGDADGDGDLDLYQVNWDEPNQLFVNPTVIGDTELRAPPLFVSALRGSATSHWVHFDLTGSTAGVIGARVRVSAGGVTQTREVSGGSGLGSQDSPRVEFGLGENAGVVDWVEVRWSTGVTHTLTNLAVDQVHAIAAPTGWANATPASISSGVRSFVSWIDYDGDDDVDLYVGSETASPANILLRNDGTAGLVPATPSALTGPPGSLGCTWGDYDNDDDPDAYVTGGGGRLVRNDGGGSFVNVTVPPLGTFEGRSPSWVDTDLDGDLDLTAGNLWGAYRYRNDGGTFADVTAPPFGAWGPILATVWSDYDNDSDPDVFLATWVGPGRLIRNDGAAFVDVTAGDLLGSPSAASASWGDFDNDGDLDLFKATAPPGGDRCRLFRNDGGSTFRDVFSPAFFGFANGSLWLDWDNDADLDLVLSRDDFCSFIRNDGGSFVEELESDLIGAVYWRGAAAGDFDADGLQDLCVTSAQGARVVRNFTAPGKRWLQLNLVGAVGNRSAIGARVRVVAGGVSQIREVVGCSGTLEQSALTVAFGLGNATLADSVIIRWPAVLGLRSNPVTILTNVAANQALVVEEGSGTTDSPVVASGPLTLALHPSFPNPFSNETTIRFDLPLAGRARIEVIDVTGRRVRTLQDGPRGAGSHTLRWDGLDDAGVSTSAGVYYYRLETSAGWITRSLVRLR
jgi:hypothetical protein